MNNEQHWPSRLVRAFLIPVIGALFFFACHGELPEVPDESSFQKEKLEKLGSLLRNELLTQHAFLAELPPYDTSVYWYLQKLYDQATSVMHLDKQSSINNKWDQERLWKAYIVKSEDRLAFALPGGDFFISTGMLKSFENDYELYALLSFEATLMNDGHLLAQWTREYNTLTISNLIEGKDAPNLLSIEVLAAEMISLPYEATVVELADKSAIENTCNTSLLSPLGLMPTLDNPDFSNSKWLLTRPSYDGRHQALPNFADDACEGRQRGNNYKRYVLDKLN
ncbi:MAG: M48 family metalloprotease [Saprospiraceae bacterium]|nr:M48 family metalloprotease [Saprospiraceae bacterium]